jgi:hypothetical protein
MSILFSRLPPKTGGTSALQRRKLASKQVDAGKVTINCGENMASARWALLAFARPV